MLEEMSVSGGGSGGGGGGGPSAFGNSGSGTGTGAGAASSGSAVGFNNTQGSTGSLPLSPPLSPMYNSPKGVSPRTNILPSFAWGKTMLKHLKRRPPGGLGGLRSQAGTGIRAGGVGGGGRGVGGGGGGGGAWGSSGGLSGMEGDGGFVYPAGMVQVR